MNRSNFEILFARIKFKTFKYKADMRHSIVWRHVKEYFTETFTIRRFKREIT